MAGIARRCLAGVVLSAIAAGGISLIAQANPDVAITVSNEPLTTTRNATLRVNIRIPEGYFVPAETAHGMSGAWLQTAYYVFENPTYQTPDLIPFAPGRSILAYRGTMTVAIPVVVMPALSTTVPLRFGFQLCRSAACTPFTIKRADANVVVRNAPAPDVRVGVRVDRSRVAVALDESLGLERDATAIAGATQFASQFLRIRSDHPSLLSLPSAARTGAAWILESGGRQFSATVDEQAGYVASCGDVEHANLAAILRVTDAGFQNEGAQHLLARPSTAPAVAPRVAASRRGTMALSAVQRAAIERLLDRHMRAILPWFFAPDPRGVVLRREGSLASLPEKVRTPPVYDAERFMIAPDGVPRVHVRVHWTGPPPVGLSLWLRVNGNDFVVESADASVTRFALMSETRDLDLSNDPEYGGVVVNVAPSADGWAYLLVGSRGYESRGVALMKYSPFGPQDTGRGIGYGC